MKSGAIAASSSASEFVDLCLNHSNGYGVDSVLITAETPSSDPVNLAARVARDRAIITAVGTVGIEIERKLYYEKELDFRISRSYGPGRYDAAFEQQGRDYPIGHVRWTETRNMEAFLQLLADGKLDLQGLVTHRFAIENAVAAYDLITHNTRPYLGVLITYPSREVPSRRLELLQPPRRLPSPGEISVGLLGAGNFARSVLIPAIRRDSTTVLRGICSATGAHARSSAAKFGFHFTTTDPEELYSDPSINTIVIATRHHLHAEQVMRALDAGKNVFCEKPLCLTEGDLRAIQQAYSRSAGRLMIGFNRRFAPLVQQLKKFLATASPLVAHYRVNAGPLPSDHWINDPEQGGGRILGEMCHFVDFLTFLLGRPVAVDARGLSTPAGQDVIASINFANGSVGTISYLASGDRAFSKERIEIFGAGKVAVLEDFRRLELVSHGRKQTVRHRFRQDKGHAAEWIAFSQHIRGLAPEPIPFEEICMSTSATIRIAEALRSASRVTLDVKERLVAPLVS